ncbi:Arc family DNA-binding protein [Sinorhizobium meliloti]|uniref:TA system antitoxin ParD family protein n=1 Tax=Rhizobium meliloti TaxID=382 RepID=UPI000FDC56AC|nr:Arc family DNA-binding protein [Sinorhizobium meliloti]RVG08571.1 Arc family DNA-binding protein [Sinorhizobium meliloti]
MAGSYSNNRRAQFQLRFNDALHEKLRASAEANSRSINSEIVHRLEASFEPDRELAPVIAQLIGQMVETEVNARLKAIAAKIGGAS